jgi:phosphomannomutase/phosphoglucomutase
MKAINAEVFRTYDIRGVVDFDFDTDWVERLGRAVGTYFRGRDLTRAVVGHDCRHSSPDYAAALMNGLAQSGVDVIAIGQVPTPVLYFAAPHLGLNAGVMVTASHNPPQFNGFKVLAGESTIHSEEIQKIRQIMERGEFAAGRGLVSVHDVVPAYLDDITSKVTVKRPVKLVVDGGNGVGGKVTAEALRRVGCTVTELFCEPDGDFPNHHPDPTIARNMAALMAKVLETGAGAGIGLDGDDDRIGAVDDNGRLLYGDELLAIYARKVLAEHPGAVIIGDVKCSHRLFADIARHGGKPIMSATGHSLIKARMRAEKAALAGEMSGHMFFADRYYGFDDATYAALRLAEVMSEHPDRLLSSYLDDWPETFNTPEIHLDCPENLKAPVIARAREHFGAKYTVNLTDGVRVEFPDGWGLARASNTQPVLVLRFEAESEARLSEIRNLIEPALKTWINELA